MAKFIIGRNYGYAGTDDEEEVECETLEEAESWAQDWALEKVDFWARPVNEEGN